MGNTVTLVYEADGNAEKAFQRLRDIYNSNYIENAVYGVILDLVPSVCYRTVSDGKISEGAGRYFEEMKRGKSGRFFCAVRERRYLSDLTELKKYRSSYARFACEGGAIGALASLIDIKRNGSESFFAYYGTKDFSDCDKVYLSGYDENGENGVLPYPGTVNALAERFDGEKAIFPKITVDKRSFFDEKEGLYPFSEYKGRSTECAFCAGKCDDKREGKLEPSRFTDAVLYGSMKLYREGDINSVSEAVLMMCAVAALNERGRLGAEETFEISENVFERLRELIFASVLEKDESESAFLLTVLSGAYAKLSSEYPEFVFLKNDVRETADILLRHSINNNVYGFYCSRKYSKISATDKLSFIAKTIIFGVSGEELNAFLRTRISIVSDIRALAGIAVYDSQNAFCEYLSTIPELEYKMRYLRSIGSTSGYYDSLNAYNGTRRLTVGARGLYPLRMRFADCGCDITLLPFAAYLERCRKYQRSVGEKEHTLTLLADNAYPLVKLMLRASAVEPEATVCVVTRDRYSHNALKKASSGRARLITRSECSVKEIKEVSAVIRQITPYTVLSELLSELERLEKG